MLLAVADCCDIESLPQFTCDFWIYHFEIVYDLTKRLSLRNRSDSTTLTDSDENDGGGGFHINQLPTEMLSKIFSYCRATDLLAVQVVCPRWHDIVHSDKGLWNHVTFSARDLDVKTTASLLWEMPLLRSVDLCNIHSSEDMTFLISVLCDACWQLSQIHFPETCEWHPSPHDLHQLNYYHPQVISLQLCTKQKLTSADISGIGAELSGFAFLKHLTLVGFYWHRPTLLPDLISQTEPLKTLSLPSVPGLSGGELSDLAVAQPDLTALTLNTSSILERHLTFKKFLLLRDLSIIDNSQLNNDKITAMGKVSFIKSLNLDLRNCCKDGVINFFAVPRYSLKELVVSNCAFSDDLLDKISRTCIHIQIMIWHNPKDAAGEMTDIGLAAVTKLPDLQSLDVKSRSVTKAYYSTLAAMRTLKYARINGMRVPGCL